MESKNIRSQTPNQHQRALQTAHSKYDAKYEVDHPKLAPESFSSELTLLEKLVQHLWVVWTVLVLAGAFITVAHAADGPQYS